MSLSKVLTRAALGVQAPLVTVEVHISKGLPALTLVGLPETTVKEARERVRSAIINSGFTFPAKRVTINLAPADLPKEGGRYDLPIAIAILAASEQLPDAKLAHYEFLGELALNGALCGVQASIPAAMAALQAGRQMVLAEENQQDVGLIQQGETLVGKHLLEICAFLHNQSPLTVAHYQPEPLQQEKQDLSEIIGQEQGRRALEITAAGGHNLLLLGPPGTGKTMLATRLPGIMPPLDDQEALECAAINSLVSSRNLHHQWRRRPFRAPHHSASLYALVGGGALPRPGEISLAHNGVLFLDELPEFDRKVLDALREPIESGEIAISRTRAKVTYPARFQLIGAMNPSPTGHYQGSHNRCTPQQVLRYLSRLSGPFLDRFDLSLEIPLLPSGTLSHKQEASESSESVLKRVLAARQRQIQRSGKVNAHLSNLEIAQCCELKQEDAVWLEAVLNSLGLSVRAWQRILKVARTIADLAEEQRISRQHLQEAVGYRSIDRLLIYLHKNLE
ncbi:MULTISPECIES: YifB family Mg chelatase-like AAA ATPase [unclassified Pantoea]|jgi:magnesium chelatase family protein|uniref:YifB family Mg chelatase-like AAA ATPase n=1 Tax=unclassified Pantoea TaxID=2630326 RepID=UPI001CD2EA08|nr:MULTISPECIES: YifB family Mg chelatase-like AAA ATPase [unclassified Pantoea]MCA1179141.1 YifB family Mg chelatase-like AAA ATPase [Pantoea sp. alder69]MCA1253770.1 YifB family Mg chelatase-like AAA ATPase [Pantoea sp. alder70]MCA1267630.1 YifB family Mg chelatase-like AAA ATPase [Pantoea sp. alder81]